MKHKQYVCLCARERERESVRSKAGISREIERELERLTSCFSWFDVTMVPAAEHALQTDQELV